MGDRDFERQYGGPRTDNCEYEHHERSHVRLVAAIDVASDR